MEFLNTVGDIISSFFKNLPQYAALITASVAILLFIFKELIEKCRKIKANKKEKIALKKILSTYNYRNKVIINHIIEYIDSLINGDDCICKFINDNEYYLSRIVIDENGKKIRKTQLVLNIPNEQYEKRLFDCIRIDDELFESLSDVYTRTSLDIINIPHHMKLLGIDGDISDSDKSLITNERLLILKGLLTKTLAAITTLDKKCKK